MRIKGEAFLIEPLSHKRNFQKIRRGKYYQDGLLKARFLFVKELGPKVRTNNAYPEKGNSREWTKSDPVTPCCKANDQSAVANIQKSHPCATASLSVPVENPTLLSAKTDVQQATYPAHASYPKHAYTFSCAFVTSKKFSKKAVVRNRARRRLRHALYEALKQNTQILKTSIAISKPASFLLLVRPHTAVLTASFPSLTHAFSGLLQVMHKHKRKVYLQHQIV